jgi:hypothetical protein
LEPSAEFLAFKKIKIKLVIRNPQDTLTFFALLENNSQELLFFLANLLPYSPKRGENLNDI